MEIFELIRKPWPWYIAGPLIGFTVPILLLLGNKSFGISSSLRHICAAVIPANISFFKYDWKKEAWNLFFVAGITLGGFVATYLLTNPDSVIVAESTKASLTQLGITDFSGLMPADIFSVENILSLKGLIFFVFGGFLVGFGTRYAEAAHPDMPLWDLLICNGRRWLQRYFLWLAVSFQPGFYCPGC